MSITFKHWVGPRDEHRVYVNGLTDDAAPFFVQGRGFVIPSFTRNSAAVLEAAKRYGIRGLTYEQAYKQALVRAEGEPLPQNPPVPPQDKMPTYRAALEQVLVVHLFTSARTVGLSFRNGLTKTELIDRICDRGEETARKVIEIVAQLKAGHIPPKPQYDWRGGEGFVGEQKTQCPTPVASIDLSEYAKRTWVTEGLQREQAGRAVLEQNLRAELEALRNLRPVVLQFPDKPEPVKIEGTMHPQFPDLILSLRAGLHCMLVGPAGSGKTHSAEQAAKALDREFHLQGAISYTHELLGYIDAHSRYVRTQFRDAFEKGGLILLDEFDASAAEAALVLNAALANGSCAFPDGLVRKHERFMCVVGANTDGSGATMQYSGRARLDGAFLDRFVVFDWQIDAKIEEALSNGNSLWLAAVRAIRDYAHKQQILDVIATPRATARGALLCQQGMARGLILERTCKRGALVSSWADVLRLPAVAAFLKG
jgi:MoxR-like ATPase